MKVNKDKKSNKKFDLEKIKVAKLKDLHLINGGDVIEQDPKTITDLSSNCNGTIGRTL